MVGTDLGGVPELITPGLDGDLVPPRDPERLAAALAGIAADPDRALAMGRAGRARLEREFTPAAHLEGLAHLYALAGVTAA
jgi:glycosyltransferase involved in cell wall biosynthesis